VADLPVPFRVTERRRETHDTWTLRLEPSRGMPMPDFAPGQFAMLYAFGAGEAPISVSAIDPGAVEHTIRAVGPVTSALCATDPGATVGLRGPFGTAWPVAAATGRDVVVIAGGLGLPPLRPVVRALLGARERYGSIDVLYGGRSPAELVYAQDLAAWGAQVSVDTAPAGWTGRVGVVTRLVAHARFDPANTIAMLCGPEVMLRFAVAALRDRGVPSDAIWVSLERSMHCGAGHCGHCQLGPLLLCRDGPVVRHDRVQRLLGVPEL
jgi:NAD(P)H-flavin reductase